MSGPNRPLPAPCPCTPDGKGGRGEWTRSTKAPLYQRMCGSGDRSQLGKARRHTREGSAEEGKDTLMPAGLDRMDWFPSPERRCPTRP
jgi:hypothetical protein